MKMKKQLIIYNCNRINAETIHRYKLLSDNYDFDIVWCYDCSENRITDIPCGINLFQFDINDIRNIPHIVFNSFKYYVAEKTDRVFRWLNSDNFVLLNNEITKNYEYVWMIEYDVCYSGKWNQFFDLFKDNTSDFVSYRLENVNVDPNWGWTRYVRDEETEHLDLYRTFMPICRASRKCINTVGNFLIDNNTKNNHHHELTWGTAVYRNNLSFTNIEDYCVKPFWSGYAHINNIQPNKLYHAVKDFIRWGC